MTECGIAAAFAARSPPSAVLVDHRKLLPCHGTKPRWPMVKPKVVCRPVLYSYSTRGRRPPFRCAFLSVRALARCALLSARALARCALLSVRALARCALLSGLESRRAS